MNTIEPLQPNDELLKNDPHAYNYLVTHPGGNPSFLMWAGLLGLPALLLFLIYLKVAGI